MEKPSDIKSDNHKSSDIDDIMIQMQEPDSTSTNNSAAARASKIYIVIGITVVLSIGAGYYLTKKPLAPKIKKQTIISEKDSGLVDSTSFKNIILSDSLYCIAPQHKSETPKFNIKLKLTMPGAASTGGLITITKNGKQIKKIHSEGILYSIDLALNSNYLFKCSKNGYITKVVYFDTHIPEGREKEEFAKFITDVELFKNPNGNTLDANKPIGGVKYDPTSEDFDKVKD